MTYEYLDYTVLIRFGDNDFGSTFKPVLLALKQWLQYTQDWDRYKDKQELAYLINLLAPAAYACCQRNASDTLPVPQRTLEYLIVDPSKILVGEEVDDLLSNHGGAANCEWFVLDMRIPAPEQQVFTVQCRGRYISSPIVWSTYDDRQ